MSLKCAFNGCASYELANANQIAFYQDFNTGGWNLGIAPEYSLTNLPSSIGLVDTGDDRFPYNVVCNRCSAKVGKVNTVCGFKERSVNFSAKKVKLVRTRYDNGPVASKWSKHVDTFPGIRKLTANVGHLAPLVGSDTLHFYGAADLPELVELGLKVSTKSELNPRRYQWRSYFFACFNNTLLCLPTGTGKTFIANLLMKAYKTRNPTKGQVFIVPTVVLVEQQSKVIEKNTGLRVVRRSGDHDKATIWKQEEICVCTSAMLLNAIKMKEVDMSQLSLLVLDEVHEANSEQSIYGLLLAYILKCSPVQRPRILGLTASPASSNAPDMRQSISALCSKLGAKPFAPPYEEDSEEKKVVSCSYIPIYKSDFEVRYENLVFNLLEQSSKLNDYFKSNWKGFLPNVSSKLKLAEIMKVISHARKFAQQDRDLALQQLISWMGKLIGSLDMLEIVGPKKLIEFIKTDLNNASLNDGLSEISVIIAPLLAQMRSTIYQIERESQVSLDSKKFSALLTELKRHQISQDRILVFVDRQDTAERLCRRLQDEPSVGKMNPDYVVGNANGNFPKELQHEILQKFKKGECQVLVATSVLEQGIDVAACGVVICFDGVKSIKAIIQSRGRARKKSAKFIALVTEEKQLKANELTLMEVKMNYAIKQLMVEFGSNFDPQLEAEITKFLESGQEPDIDAEQIDDDTDEDEDDYELEEDKTFFACRFTRFKDSDALSDHISSLMSPRDRLKIKKRCIEAFFVVPKNDQYAGCEILKKISFKIDPKIASKLRAWVETSSLPLQNVKTARLDFDMMTGFCFHDYTKVVLDSNVIWSEHFQMEIGRNEMILQYNLEEFLLTPIDFDGPIFINDTGKIVEIYLNLRNPPRYFVKTEHVNLFDADYEEMELNRYDLEIIQHSRSVTYDKEQAHFDFSNRSYNLCLRRNRPIDERQYHLLRCALQNFSIEIYHICHLEVTQSEIAVRDLSSNYTNHPDYFKKSYMIKAWHNKYAAILPPQLSNEIIKKFHQAPSVTSLDILLETTVPIRFQQLFIQETKPVKLPFEDKVSSNNFVMIGRVKVMPTRFKFMPFSPVQKNRVFRYFPDPDNFLVVSFTDEHGGNPWRSTNVYKWFFSVILQGIIVGGKCFTFLGCSNSQLREGHCWFSCLDRQMVYDKIGDFTPIKFTAGRKLTRLASAFASSIETVPLDYSRYLANVQDDIETEVANFSDGIGRATPELFARIRKMIPTLPMDVSALQIRVGGIKGVISLFDQQNGDDVTFRKSMKKFESEHNMLEVLNFSFSIPLSLNRHVVLLLSNFGIPNEVFLEFEHEDIFKCLEALIDDEKALAFVKQRSSIFNWSSYSIAQLGHEPLFRQILVSNTIELVSKIVDHAHISVRNGRILMGVLDETRTLNYGEVYAHIVEDQNDFELEGKVVVFRNPCVLPSDIRVLTARKDVSPRIKNLYRNCLVIPSRGPVSHAQECSGGDLDGDLYYIIWEKQLVPRFSTTGHAVVKVNTIEFEKPDGSSDYDMMDFFCKYVAQNQLGVIANAHLAMADKYGMMDERTVTLARYVTAETDAPRKGLTVGKIDPKLLPTEYPDYMKKGDKTTYKSSTVLGELFRNAAPLLDVLLEKRIFMSPRARYDFLNQNESIEHYYAIYSFEIKKMLQSFELASEADLFSGTPMLKKDYMSNYKQQTHLRETVNEIVKDFWQKWNQIFDRFRIKNLNNHDLILQWYNRPKTNTSPAHSFSFLAIPFINSSNTRRQTLVELVQSSSIRWIFSNKFNWLDEYRIRLYAGKMIHEKLGDVEFHFYGSSMLGLFEDYSDIDICVLGRSMESLQKALTVLDPNAVSCQKPHACVSLTYNSMKIDVTSFKGGVEKTYSLAAVFDKVPGAWGALRVLIEWARNVKIVKSGGSLGFMNVVSFCHLFIYYVTKSVPNHVEATPYTLPRFNTWIESNAGHCGQFIYEFLNFISQGKNKSWIASLREPITEEVLIKDQLIEELRKNAEIALYILAVHDGDILKLFQFCSKKRLFKIDKRYMNPRTICKDDITQCFKELKMKCNPTKNPELELELLERNGVFFLEVVGNFRLFPDVEIALTKIHSKIVSARASGLKNRIFHIANSTMVIPEFSQGIYGTEVSFASYQSEYHQPQHAGMWKSVMTFRNQKNNEWRISEYQRYSTQFLEQLQLFAKKLPSHKSCSNAARFFGELQCTISCGNQYLFNIPESLHNTFETISLYQVQRNISAMEEALNLEKRQDIEMKTYNPRTLLKMEHPQINTNEVLKLVPLQELKKRTHQKKQVEAITSRSRKKSGGIRNSFYPHWQYGEDKLKKFASDNGFVQVSPIEMDHYTKITVFWRQRELHVVCSNSGTIRKIEHRSVRWVSSTFKRYDAGGGDDVRIYLKTNAKLNEDETCLETIIEFLNGQSVFKETFAQQIIQENCEDFEKRPLIPDIFHLNWRFRSMRYVKTSLKFINKYGDLIYLHVVHDGVFSTDRQEFEWFPKHFELDMQMCMKTRTSEELCKASYEMSLALFDFTKKP